MIDFGKKLLILRQNRGLSRDTVSKKTGVHEVTIRNYELNKSVPPLDFAIKVCSLYGIDLNYFLDDDNVDKEIYSDSGNYERVTENLGSKIKEARKSYKLTQAELAKELDVFNTYISDYENSKKLPDLDILLKMADFFKLPLGYFFVGSISLEPYTFSKNAYNDLKSLLVKYEFMKDNDDISDDLYNLMLNIIDMHLQLVRQQTKQTKVCNLSPS